MFEVHSIKRKTRVFTLEERQGENFREPKRTCGAVSFTADQP